ncbi:PDZ domain-containing protein GIPC2 isoform X1 [Hydra vulgaris]|uniref:PDZ domain-containing protein GIPC2 isoform X1 n=1 Tax=Hydra vulgaris TaxID=6087 RepID=UPI000192461F|nr:PDZ domain-containing protein GIPC2 [Hydra vulgaris]
MPLFSKKEKKSPKKDTNTLTEEDEEKIKQIQEDSRAHVKQLSFSVQLAHGSPTAKISNFSSVKELYQKIAEGLNITMQDIMYCTLNSPKVDMEKLLGGQIGLQDLIFVHCKGASKNVTLFKDAPTLGLTITDNGNGFAFIKRVKNDSVASRYSNIYVGDHIEEINGENVVGIRHFEVAKILREINEGDEFSLKLCEPIRGGFDEIAPRQGKGGKASDNLGSGKATLRLRSKGPATVEEVLSWEGPAIVKVDDLLEKFLGIRDPELANTLIDLAKNIENPSNYATAVETQLGDFGFPDEFIFDIWGAYMDAKAGRI